MSETATCRERLAQYCTGVGVDLGFGGDGITPTAICIDRAEDDLRRSKHPNPMPTHLVGDIARLHWFQDDCLDFVYSSHALEDFLNTKGVLKEWLRVLKPGGRLVLFLPDQAAYAAHCAAHSLSANKAHVHQTFSLKFVQQYLRMLGVGPACVIHQLFPVPNNAYSFDLVVKKP